MSSFSAHSKLNLNMDLLYLTVSNYIDYIIVPMYIYIYINVYRASERLANQSQVVVSMGVEESSSGFEPRALKGIDWA